MGVAAPPSAAEEKGEPRRRAASPLEHLPVAESDRVLEVDGGVEVPVEVAVPVGERGVVEPPVELDDLRQRGRSPP